MKKLILITVLFTILLVPTWAQVAINETGAAPSVSAILDLSSTDKGLLIPRMTTNNRTTNTTPVAGLMVYDTDTESFWYYDGTQTNWVEIKAGSALDINNLADGSSDGTSVFLGDSTGSADEGNNYCVALGIKALKNNNSGEGNVALGNAALANSVYRSDLVAIGDSAMYNNGNDGPWSVYGIYNTAVGASSLFSNVHGSQNTAYGYQSIYSNTYGFRNTAIGFKSLFSNIDGDNNTAIGIWSLYSNTEGNDNTAIGRGSLYSNTTGDENTATGMYSLLHHETGDGNTANGYEALYSDTIGQGNTAIGNRSLYHNLDGNYNTALGRSSLYDNTSGDYNTAIGVNSMGNNTTAYYNTAIGYNSLYNDTTGGYNSATGSSALYYNRSGKRNTANGYRSLNNNTTANSNVAVGSYSLYSNTDRSNLVAIGDSALYNNGAGATETFHATANTAVGSKTLYSNTTGNGNVGIGSESLYYNITGSENTAVGYQAGWGNWGYAQNAIGCVYLGYQAGKYNSSSNKLYIDNSSVSFPLIGGDFDVNRVDINGTIKITGGTPGSGKVLTSDASGLASWETPMTYASSINDLSDAIYDGNSIFLGEGSGVSDDGSNSNTAIGHYSLANNTSGIYNTATGYQSLLLNTTGSWNSAYGYITMENNTTGEKNSSFGFGSLRNNIDGDFNVAMGYNAGLSSTGSGNIFIGYEAGLNETGSNKLYIDNSNTSTPLLGGDFSSNQININGTIKITGGTPGSGKVLTSDANGLASWETPTVYASAINDLSDAINSGTKLFMGTNAGLNNTGSYNTGVGYESLKLNSTGTYNTAFGYKTLDANTEGYGNTGLGHGSLGANTTGDYNTAVGREALDANTTGNYNTAVGFNAFPSGTYSNSVAIGYNASISGNNQIHLGNTSITEIKGQVAFTTYSDGRIKENIREDVKGLDFILKLRPVTYNINLDKENQLLGIKDDSDLPTKYDIEKIKRTGFIAQEVEEAAKSTSYEFSGVQKPKNDKDLYGLSYAEFVVPLVKSVQELNQKLEKENAELKARLDKLEELLNQR